MPNRTQVRRNSVVDLLAKVPVNKGSLLTSIENLLKTIESSESAVMIPTLLRDKCEFDAWELLFVAKILKASILGHVDLVEFYMNHIGLNSSQFTASQTSNTTTNGNGTTTNATTPTATASSATTPNNSTDNSINQSQSLSPSAAAAATNGHQRQPSSGLSPTNPTVQLPESSSISSAGSATTIQSGSSSNVSSTKSQSSVSWTTANQQSSSAAATSTSGASSSDGDQTDVATFQQDSGSGNGSSQPPQVNGSAAASQESLLAPVAAVKPQFVRQAQPPSLLQLTTTNNHINSVAAVAAGFTNNTIEQLTNQLSGLQQANGHAAGRQPVSRTNGAGSLDGALSISTSAANQQSAGAGGLSSGLSSQTISNGAANGGLAAAVAAAAASIASNHPPHAELRSSRSAGCLFRINSGASSPRTPTTPYPQAETLANGQPNRLPGDPSAPVKLLLQIEQLKLSIGHVTSLLESVVELYKRSIDNIAMA